MHVYFLKNYVKSSLISLHNVYMCKYGVISLKFPGGTPVPRWDHERCSSSCWKIGECYQPKDSYSWWHFIWKVIHFISLNSVLHKLFDRLTINMYSVYPFMTLMVVNCIYLSSNLYNNVKTYGFFLVLLLVRNGVIEQSLTGLKVFIYFR